MGADLKNLKFMLLQARDPGDPMAEHEIDCFVRVIGCEQEQLMIHNLIHEKIDKTVLDEADIILFGGAGGYEVSKGGDWMPPVFEVMQELYEESKPTFSSCWGCQAMALALGGEVVNDRPNAEVGTFNVYLTEAGKSDPVFGGLPETFLGLMGHEDRVSRLPEGAILLASSDKVENQAFTFPDKPIYCTQFHPELNCEDLDIRVSSYPKYIHELCGMSYEKLIAGLRPVEEQLTIIRRFIESIFG